MTEPIQNLSAFATSGKSKIDKNNVDMSDRKKLKDNVEFKQDKKITADEYRMLKKEFGMNEAQVKEWLAVEGGQDFLEAMLHAEGTTKKEIKAAREQIAKEFLLKDRTIHLGSSDANLVEQLREFGVDVNEQADFIEDNYMAKEYPIQTITPDPASGNTTVQKVRVHVPEDINGDKSLKRLDLFEAVEDYDAFENMNAVDSNPLFKGSLLLDEETGMYVKYNHEEGVDNQYYRLNGDGGLVEVSKAAYDGLKAALNADETGTTDEVDETGKTGETEEVVETPEEKAAREAQEAQERAEAEAQAKAQAAADTKAAFEKVKSITVDSTGSKQKLWLQDVRDTGVVVLKKKGFAENGLPKEIAIELPGSYGQKSADGVQQKRYQHWVLLDAEKGIYGDRAGIRKFQASIDEEGKIKFTQVDINDAKIKDFLNKNTKAAAEKAKEAGLNDGQNKMEIKDKAEADTLMGKLADRNQSWETYLQVGTDNGYITGSQGLLEKLVDEGDTTGIKTYNDLKPAIDGLLARVPEAAVDTPEYKAVKDLVDKLATNPDAELKTGWFKTMFGAADPVRDLDMALMNLAKKHIAGQVQGTNHANNSFLVGGNGKVTIQPDDPKSGFMSDAKFTIGGQDYYMYEPNEALWIDRTIDFQDLVTHKGEGDRALITNDVTGNNRHGEIKFNAEKLVEMDEALYLEGGNPKQKYDIKAENGVAYIYSPDGSVKVPIEDVLNGRAGLPANAPAAS